MTRELKYFILWFFFGLIFAFVFSQYFNFPFLPKKKYEQGFWNYLSRFLIFFIPYFFFLIIRLIFLIIYKLRIIKANNKPSVIASVLFFTLFFGFFANHYANEHIYLKLVNDPFIYEPITQMDKDYKKVSWSRRTDTRFRSVFSNPGLINETLIFNSDTTAELTKSIIDKNDLFLWKYLLNLFDYTGKELAIVKDDSLLFYYKNFLYDSRFLIFKNDTLRFEPRNKYEM
ncbi:MAG: hypothetical protein ROY99_15325 [Ignavibacterium sp.]|jgi:hypothetical protein|nr:hypothetical protein [Ignavibacterium sp.]